MTISRTSSFWNSSVLKSLEPVISQSKLVKVNEEKIKEVASWMAYEEFPKPTGAMLFDFGNDPDFLIDLQMVTNTLNFAFTNFETGVKFQTEYLGQNWSDSEAMMACFHRTYKAGIPFFDGKYLATITDAQLAEVFAGNMEIPLFSERLSILREVGAKLTKDYDGKFHKFVRSCEPKLYANGNGLLERLVSEFPRFADTSNYHGSEIQIYKLAQLGIWGMHLTLAPRGFWQLDDANMLTAFADYIVPVGLRVMGIFEYSSTLEAQINNLTEIVRDSDAEIELRALTIYAIALLTEEINRLRPNFEPLLMPQVDFRFWKTYHATHWPHHLTKTIMY